MKVFIYYAEDESEQFLDASTPQKERDALIFLFHYFQSLGRYEMIAASSKRIQEIRECVAQLESIEGALQRLNRSVFDAQYEIEGMRSEMLEAESFGSQLSLYKRCLAGNEQSILEFMQIQSEADEESSHLVSFRAQEVLDPTTLLSEILANPAPRLLSKD